MANIRTGRKSGFIMRGGVSRRETRWLDAVPIGISLGAPSTAVITHSLTAVELALRPFTVIRTRGFWTSESDQFITSEAWQVALGHCVVSDQAVAIGVTAVPTPETDMESDLWYVYEQLMGSFLFGDATGFQEAAAATGTFDSKAMRKVEDGQDIVSVIETAAISAGAVVRVGFRSLIKLH